MYLNCYMLTFPITCQLMSSFILIQFVCVCHVLFADAPAKKV